MWALCAVPAEQWAKEPRFEVLISEDGLNKMDNAHPFPLQVLLH